MADRVFRDRTDAGQTLAGLLDRYRGRPNVTVLGLARGGVAVAHEVAAALGAPLDVFLVRKLGVPGREEMAMGAVASGGVVVLNDGMIRGLGIEQSVLRGVVQREERELERRERAYRDDREPPPLADRTVILVDDGLATGASMRAAVMAVRESHPARIVVAVPVAPESACRGLGGLVDEVVCATTPYPFIAVGESYWDFRQATDAEVRELLGVSTWRTSPVHDGVIPDDALFDMVGDARFVLFGEASHGTHEFYAARAQMTQRLIEAKGFCAVAVEADWPDAYRVNRFVHGHGTDVTAEAALRGFERFPTWMWRNTVVLDFVAWLRAHNVRAGRDERAKAGFYGLDIYSLYRSIHEVIAVLDRVDPAAAARARDRYACFEQAGGGDAHAYGYAAAFGAGESCQDEVLAQLVDLQREALPRARRLGLVGDDELFYAQQNATVVKAAEEYYRTMFTGRVDSWNLRDRHMADTLDSLVAHLTRQRGRPAKVVVWAHNSHVGDARATELGGQGELTIGQLLRERHPDDCRLIGFTTYGGTVTAADRWGGPAERKRVRPALPDSVEELFHEAGEKEFWVHIGQEEDAVLHADRLQRGIGVVYRPDAERRSHYFQARLGEEFDATIHIDETHAVEPLEPA